MRGKKGALQGSFKWGKQKHYRQKLKGVFFIVLNVKNEKALAFKLKLVFYRLSIARWVF